MPPTSLGDISSFVRTTDPDDFELRFNESEATNCAKAGALILNTFENLEADVLAALRSEYPCIYTIGPLGSLLNEVSAVDSSTSGLSLWMQDTECLTWLETQEARSVVYVNFGSHTVLTPAQLAEFACALADSGHALLWSIRENLVPGGGGLAALMGGSSLLTRGQLPPLKSLISFSAPGRAPAGVRRHDGGPLPPHHVVPAGAGAAAPAVGCFLTHNGWNSTCESLAAGVPMVCWPGFADQYTNCKHACEVWGVGLRLDNEVRREQVAGHVRRAMEAEPRRRSGAAPQHGRPRRQRPPPPAGRRIRTCRAWSRRE
ncbi:hypothetical protein ACQ4PT_065015 [Festuca glaucescens]